MEQEVFNYQRIQQAIEFLTANFKSQPSLEEVAQQVHMSPHHFQKVFTEWAGVSPKKFLQFLTLDYLRKKIQDTANMNEAAQIAGLSSQSRVYDLFVTIEGVTPQTYKTAGMGLTIYYGYHLTPFGECFIATTEKSICALAFVDASTAAIALQEFSQKWAFAQIKHDAMHTEKFIQQIFSSPIQGVNKLHLLLQGTNFQIKVWEALLKIPFGAVSTYQYIAQSIANPKAVRAVGTAVGDNPIAYLIPCHRVIRKEGKLGEYRWGATRKSAIIGWEASKTTI